MEFRHICNEVDQHLVTIYIQRKRVETLLFQKKDKSMLGVCSQYKVQILYTIHRVLLPSVFLMRENGNIHLLKNKAPFSIISPIIV